MRQKRRGRDETINASRNLVFDQFSQRISFTRIRGYFEKIKKMKLTLALCVMAVVLYSSVEAASIDDLSTCEPGKKYPTKPGEGCGLMTCGEDGRSMSGVGCGQYICAPGKHTGKYTGDKTKGYPDCCVNPICED